MPATVTAGSLIGGPLTDLKIGVDASEVSVGPTLAPLRWRKETTWIDYRVEQKRGIIKKEEATTRYYISTVVAHATLENLRIALNQIAANLSGSTLTVDEDVLGQQSLLAEGPGPSGLTRTLDFPIVVSMATGDIVTIEQSGQQGFPVEFEVLQNPSTGAWFTVLN